MEGVNEAKPPLYPRNANCEMQFLLFLSFFSFFLSFLFPFFLLFFCFISFFFLSFFLAFCTFVQSLFFPFFPTSSLATVSCEKKIVKREGQQNAPLFLKACLFCSGIASRLIFRDSMWKSIFFPFFIFFFLIVDRVCRFHLKCAVKRGFPFFTNYILISKGSNFIENYI